MLSRKERPAARRIHAGLRAAAKRVKALLLEQKAIGSDVTDVCREAKEVAGLDPTTLRFVAREALMDKDKRAERDQQTANEILTAIGAIRDERDRLREVNQELLSALEITEARLDALMRSREMDSTTRPFHAVRTIRDDARAAIAKATT